MIRFDFDHHLFTTDHRQLNAAALDILDRSIERLRLPAAGDLRIGASDNRARLRVLHEEIEKAERTVTEERLREGSVKCVVCTSSLDLGVDFSPVDQVIQVGSPKGMARLMQRAGRSGHRPGAVSRVFGVPTNAFELVEFAAARGALAERKVEARRPLRMTLDVLAQHLLTVSAGGGFEPEAGGANHSSRPYTLSWPGAGLKRSASSCSASAARDGRARSISCRATTCATCE